MGKADLDTLLSEREELNEELQKIIDEQTEPWGVKVTTVEIKDVGIPQAMQHAMARQAQAERERRAKVINAEGEFQAAARLSEAADVISQNPTTIQLRYLQTLSEIGVNQNSTVVFPLPFDMIKPLLEAKGEDRGRRRRSCRAATARPRSSAPKSPAGDGHTGGVGSLCSESLHRSGRRARASEHCTDGGLRGGLCRTRLPVGCGSRPAPVPDEPHGQRVRGQPDGPARGAVQRS